MKLLLLLIAIVGIVGCSPQPQVDLKKNISASPSPSPSPSPTGDSKTISKSITPLEPEKVKAPLEAAPEQTVDSARGDESTVETPEIEKRSEFVYIEGTCKALKTQGLGPFYKNQGDPNYTTKRDRDGDGIACE